MTRLANDTLMTTNRASVDILNTRTAWIIYLPYPNEVALIVIIPALVSSLRFKLNPSSSPGPNKIYHSIVKMIAPVIS